MIPTYASNGEEEILTCLLQAMVRGAFRETLGELDTREYRDLRKPKRHRERHWKQVAFLPTADT